MIDTHHHFWRYDPEEFGWIPKAWSGLHRDFGPEDLEPVLRGHGVTGVVSVQARQSEEETRWLLSLAERWGFIAGVVGWLPIGAADFGLVLERYESPKLKGLRHVVQGEPAGFLGSAGFNAGIERLTKRGLGYDLLIKAEQLQEAIAFVDRHPGQVFIVDHLAKPSVPYGRRNLEPWRGHVMELARRENTYMKLSGGVLEADPTACVEQLEPYFDVLLEAFSPARLMFGSNWPLTEIAPGSYGTWLGTVKTWAGRLSDSQRQDLFHRTAAVAYRLDL